MTDFIQPLGSLPSGGKRRVFNPSTIGKHKENPSTEQLYDKAATDEEKRALYQKALAEYEREKARDRMSIC
jgi:hypothetical protein